MRLLQRERWRVRFSEQDQPAVRNTNKNRKAMAKKATPVPNNLNISLCARVMRTAANISAV